MRKSTKRSHYLPITYLKHFLCEGKLFMYKKGEKFFRNTQIGPEERILEVKSEEGLKNVGLQNNLYNPGVDEISSDDLENTFAVYGETFYNNTIEKIEKLQTGEDIPKEVKDNLCYMMSSMRVRTPLFKWETEQIDGEMRKHLIARQIGSMTPEEIVSLYNKEIGKEISLEMAKNTRERFIDKEYNLKYPNGHFLKIALMSIEQHVDIFHQMTFTIYKSNNGFFITTDNPLVYFVPREHLDAYTSPKSLTSPYCEVYFPLTNKMALLATWKKGKETLSKANEEIIDVFNYNLSHNSFEYFFSPLKMNSLNKFIESYIPYPFKFNIY